MLWWVDLDAVWRQLRLARWSWLGAALACSVLANLGSAWRWRSLVRWLGHPLAMGRAQGLYFQGVALGSLLPGAVVGGDVYRTLALRRDGMPMLAASASVLLDRLSGLWMLWILAGMAAAWAWRSGAQQALTGWGLPAAGAWVPALAAVALLAAPGMLWALLRRVEGAGTRGGWQRLAGLARRPGAAAELGRQALASAVVQALSVGALACAGQALQLPTPYWVYAIAAAPTFLMAALPLSFGGWGTREAAAALSLAPFGVAAAGAVAVSLVFGLLVLPQALAGALLLLLGRRASAAA